MSASSGNIESIWSNANGWQVHSRAALRQARDNAPDVVLVHGLVVASKYMEPLAEYLARDYRVFVPDLPGFGHSDKPDRILDVPELADALLDWMDSVGLQSPMLVGNSFGCQIVVEFAMKYPSRVRSLVLVGPTADPEGRDLPTQTMRWIRNSFIEPLSLGPTLVRDYVKAGPLRAISTLNVYIKDRVEEKLGRVPVPTLVVRGSLDPIVPDRWAKQAIGLLPRGEGAVIPGVGHTANYSAPLEIARVARIFDGHPDHVFTED